MKLHENWCIDSPDGMHCFHIIMPEDNKLEPTQEVCCWCDKIQNIYYITGIHMKPHGKHKYKYKLLNLLEMFKNYGGD